MTAVESGKRALQYLGLDGDKSPVEFDVRIGFLLMKFSGLFRWIDECAKHSSSLFVYC